ncbi:MAG: ABC transporter ATP-binding protein [Acidobacteriota bacterium]
MNYTLNAGSGPQVKRTLRSGIQKLAPLVAQEKSGVILAMLAICVSSGAGLIAPVIIARAIDTSVRLRDAGALMNYALILLGIYLVGVTASYFQVRIMGGVGRKILFSLRNTLFTKLQSLPVAFFNQNKAGDLISRLNNDTDKLNQFVSQAMMQFAGSVVLMTGVSIFLLSLDVRLGAAALLPALGVLLITKATGAWVKGKNLGSLQSLGGMSSEIQEGLHNFKVIVAFHRTDYFRSKFTAANERNYTASVAAGYANNVFMPLYGLAANVAQLIVIGYGIALIQAGQATIGLLIGFLLYVNSFYGPLRQLATVWSSFQMAVAGLDRISEVLALESNMPVLPAPVGERKSVLEFRKVRFQYPDGKEVLRGVNFDLQPGKSYALVGPTGGGKTTTALLMARLYDPSEGTVLLDGRDIRSYAPEERARKIGFILQEPFLCSGTVGDNIFYGNAEYTGRTPEQLAAALEEANFSKLLSRFPAGLSTPVAVSGNSISLGQKQLIAFMRAVLRKPEILILDEATANIDTVTEQLLEEVLQTLPRSATKVIIAHRLNTIDNVDQIFFVNSGEISIAGSMEHALDLLLHGKRAS